MKHSWSMQFPIMADKDMTAIIGTPLASGVYFQHFASRILRGLSLQI